LFFISSLFPIGLLLKQFLLPCSLAALIDLHPFQLSL
jgi:hypothetical protein